MVEIPKVEDYFWTNRRFFLIRKIEQFASDYHVRDSYLTTIRKVHKIPYEEHSELWYISRHPNGTYKTLGTLRELHELKDSIVPMMIHRGLNPDENWLIIERLRKNNE